MIYRPQRGGLAESLQEAVRIDRSLDALAAHLHATVEEITIQYYLYDERLHQESYVVFVNREPFGFIDENPCI